MRIATLMAGGAVLMLGLAPGARAEDELKLGVKPRASATTSLVPQPTRQNQQEKLSVIKLHVPATMSRADAWEQHFAGRQEVPATVRETVRSLMSEAQRFVVRDDFDSAQQRFDDVISLIYAALRNDQAQQWMYEALGLAMQAKGADKSEIERALMSTADFSNNMDDLMIVAQYMARTGLETRALSLFREVSSANPARPEPYVAGLRIAKRLQDIDAIRWACAGILSQAWPTEYQHIEREAYDVARATLLYLREQEQTDQLRAFDQSISSARVRDCVVNVTWTGNADVDLMVEEPTGTVCSHHNPQTTAGGVLIVNGDASTSSGSVGGISEQYVCARGFPGVYRVLVRRVWGSVTTGKVTVEVKIHQGTQYEETRRDQIELVDGTALVVFELSEGRRNESLEQHLVTNVARRQYELGRAALLQQSGLSSLQNSETSRRYLAVQSSRCAGRSSRRAHAP